MGKLMEVMKMFSKEINRWLRALGIAKILFEDQGYHCLYLDGIEKLVRRKFMYSPKISEELIPKIFKVAKAERIPMTTLVNRILEEALNGGGQHKGDALASPFQS